MQKFLALDPHAAGVAAIIAATVLWAIGSVTTKHSLQQFGAMDLVVIELAASTLSLWAVMAFRGWYYPSFVECVRLALPGMLQPGLAYSLAFVGLQWTTVSLETLLWSSESAVMLPFAFYFLGESVSLATGALGGLAIAGVVIASFSSVLGARTDANALAGDMLILAAVLSACGYTVFAQKDLSNHDPLPLVALHQLAGLMLVILVRALWADHFAETSGPHPVATYVEASLAGVCLFSAPFWLFLLSIKKLGSAKASQFLPLVPVLTMLLASQTLGERITPLQAIGSVITIAAVFALSFAGAKSASSQQTTNDQGEKHEIHNT